MQVPRNCFDHIVRSCIRGVVYADQIEVKHRVGGWDTRIYDIEQLL